jgi:hypothetical protein
MPRTTHTTHHAPHLQDVVLIDDARLFSAGRVNDGGGDPWPDVTTLQGMFCARYPDWLFDLHDDMFIAHANPLAAPTLPLSG